MVNQMGIFSKPKLSNDPFANISLFSSLNVMPGKYPHSSQRFLWFMKSSFSASSDLVETVQLGLSVVSKPPLLKFLHALIESQALLGEEDIHFTVPGWPNSTRFDSPYVYSVSQGMESGFKDVTFFGLMDSNNPGVFYIHQESDGQVELVEAINLGIALDSDYGFKFWNLCSSSPDTKTGLFFKVLFAENETEPSKLLLAIPRNFMEISSVLSQSGFRK